MVQGSTLMKLMNDGGWVMWALLVFSIVALATAIERAIVLRRADTELAGLVSKLRTALMKRRSIADAVKEARLTTGAAARVAETGLHRFERGPAQIEKSMERRALGEIRRINLRMRVLATIAGTAPLLGFLGTVTGMMESFGALMEFGMTNPGMVAQGIKEALTTTAAGLVVAVPTQLLYNALAAKTEKITHDMESIGNFLLEAREELA